MEASFRIAQVSFLLDQYREATHRPGMQDLAVWQGLEAIYALPDEYNLVVTSTKEEAFDRMVKDNWFINMGDHFFGVDYETTDELVLNYLKDNQLVKDISEEDTNE